MKKKIIFDGPTDVVGIEEISPKGFFLADKNGRKAILINRKTWVSVDTLSELIYISGETQKKAITNARDNGCTIYQYDSFDEFCKEYIAELE